MLSSIPEAYPWLLTLELLLLFVLQHPARTGAPLSKIPTHSPWLFMLSTQIALSARRVMFKCLLGR